MRSLIGEGSWVVDRRRTHRQKSVGQVVHRLGICMKMHMKEGGRRIFSE